MYVPAHTTFLKYVESNVLGRWENFLSTYIAPLISL